jgi:hypothetical protein
MARSQGQLYMVFLTDPHYRLRWERTWREKVQDDISVDIVVGDQPELIDRPKPVNAIQHAYRVGGVSS